MTAPERDHAVRSLDLGAIFYPRGGSAQLIRYLVPHLERYGDLRVRLFVGSLGEVGALSHAQTFYQNIEVLPADYTAAVADASSGLDPMLARVPLHPSYEDRHGVPDRIFTAVSPEQADHLERFWTGQFRELGAQRADVLHLFHLTPLHAAAAALRPGRALVTTLCGTELKMMDAAERRLRLARRLGTTPADLADQFERAGAAIGELMDQMTAEHDLDTDDRSLLASGRWEQWRYAEYWLSTMRRWADSSSRLVVSSDHDNVEAQRILGRSAADLVQLSPGVDVERFVPLGLSDEQRLSHLRTWLVRESKAALPDDVPGSLRYTETDIDRLRLPDGSLRPILLFVGRFLEFKRLRLLIRAFAKVRTMTQTDPLLIIWGGYPGELEGEHPFRTVAEHGLLDDVYFIGWRDHADLSIGLNVSDVMVAPAYNESFGQVYLEAMACGRPVVASASGGPLNFVHTAGPDANGWLVTPDDDNELAETLRVVVTDPQERRRRGEQGLSFVRRNYSWAAMAVKYLDVYAGAIRDAKAGR